MDATTLNAILATIDSDVISIILSILSFLLAALSLIFIWMTLKQNNKMLYANSRPYVVAYFSYEENNTELYFCVKNFGNSSAIIRSLDLKPDLNIMQLSIADTLKDAALAPSQQLHFLIPQKDQIIKDGPFQFHVEIEYEDVNLPKKHLRESYNIDLNYILQVLHGEHRISNLNQAENALRNMEKDIKAIMLSKL